MEIDEKALDEFLSEPLKDEGIPAEIRKVLDRIWERNDSLRTKRGPGYITKQRAIDFFRSQGIHMHADKLTYWARLCGRFSWDKR